MTSNQTIYCNKILYKTLNRQALSLHSLTDFAPDELISKMKLYFPESSFHISRSIGDDIK